MSDDVEIECPTCGGLALKDQETGDLRAVETDTPAATRSRSGGTTKLRAWLAEKGFSVVSHDEEHVTMYVAPPDLVKETTRLSLALRYEHSIVCGPAVTAEAVPSVHCVFDPFHPASADLVLEGVTDTMLRDAARPALRIVR